MNKDLRNIKRHYGEDMMHLCRKLFPTILEEEGRLFELMQANFYNNRYLYDDLVKYNLTTEFKDYIYEKFDDSVCPKEYVKVSKTPKELLKEAGYTLYECKSQDDIQQFKRYYANGEELCTFDEHRLDSCFVFFAVKDNASELKREDFDNPDRQDEYGTSVISIQYRRGNRNTLSVKNRYNHTVENPDATFGNNLDNIIPGLNKSFEETYNFRETGSNNSFNITRANYVKAKDGRYYKYNYEINNCYFCLDNIIIDNYEVIDKYHVDMEKYIILDYYIIDLVNKKISTYGLHETYIYNINNIEKIDVVKNKETGNKTITIIMYNKKKVIFEINKLNQIIKLYDEYTEDVPNSALRYLKYIEELSMPNVRRCGHSFLKINTSLKQIWMPLVECVDAYFLMSNRCLSTVYFPYLKEIGNFFLRSNDIIQELSLPSAEIIGDDFMALNMSLKEIGLPNVRTIGGWFLSMNNKITEIDMPILEKVLCNFLSNDYHLIYANLPKLVSVTNNFLPRALIEIVSFPNLRHIGDNFMRENTEAREINLPNVTGIGSYFMQENRLISVVDLPNVRRIGDYFLCINDNTITFNAPNLEEAGYGIGSFKLMDNGSDCKKLVRKKHETF